MKLDKSVLASVTVYIGQEKIVLTVDRVFIAGDSQYVQLELTPTTMYKLKFTEDSWTAIKIGDQLVFDAVTGKYISMNILSSTSNDDGHGCEMSAPRQQVVG